MIRKIDPTVMANRDILDGAGKVLVEEGTIFNPLDKMPFIWNLIVFNPNSKKQVEFVKNILDSNKDNSHIQLIATQMEEDDAWKQLRDLDHYFMKPVYMLDNLVKNRFVLKNTPSIVYADHEFFYVHEYPVDAVGAIQVTEKKIIKKNESETGNINEK